VDYYEERYRRGVVSSLQRRARQLGFDLVEAATIPNPGVSWEGGGVLREGLALRYAVITRHRGKFAERLMCRVLEVVPSGYYASLERPPSWHALIDEVLMARVRIIHHESSDTYGAPRIHRALQTEGLPTSAKRVARLMREEELVARPRKRPRVSTTDSNHPNPTMPNLVARLGDGDRTGRRGGSPQTQSGRAERVAIKPHRILRSRPRPRRT
jgi:hypothetical protein